MSTPSPTTTDKNTTGLTQQPNFTMAPTKKSKKDAQSISNKLALVLKSGKVTLGYVCSTDSLDRA